MDNKDIKNEKKSFHKMLIFKIFILLGYLLAFLTLVFVVARCSKDVSATSYIDNYYEFDNYYENAYGVSYMSLNDFQNMSSDNYNSPNLINVSQSFQNNILLHINLNFTYNYSFVFYAHNTQNLYKIRILLLDNLQSTLQTIDYDTNFTNGWHNVSFDVDFENVEFIRFAFVTPHTSCDKLALYFENSLDHFIPYSAYVLYEATNRIDGETYYYMIYALYNNGNVFIYSFNTYNNNNIQIQMLDNELFNYARFYLITTMHDFSIGTAVLYCPKNKDFTFENISLNITDNILTFEGDYTSLRILDYNSYNNWSTDTYKDNIVNGGMTPFHKEIFVSNLDGFNNVNEMLFYFLNGFESQINGSIKYHNEYLFGDLVSSFLNISFGTVQVGSTTFNFTLGLLLLFIIGLGALLVILKVMMGG